MKLTHSAMIEASRILSARRSIRDRSKLAEVMIAGNSIDVMRSLPSRSCQSCVTSPPYYRMRVYEGLKPVRWADGSKCILGLEETPDQFVAHLVDVFREAKRVLCDDGVLLVNLGDSYGGTKPMLRSAHSYAEWWQDEKAAIEVYGQGKIDVPAKSMLGVPFRLALAMMRDGWLLRNDIPWIKRNPVPGGPKDRLLRGHEYFFMFSKSHRYFFDYKAVQVYSAKNARDGSPSDHRFGRSTDPFFNGIRAMRDDFAGMVKELDSILNGEDRALMNHDEMIGLITGVANNAGSKKKYGAQHFATFPRSMILPLVKATSREGDVVLDPFFGSGTVGEVAASIGRGFCGIDVSPVALSIAAQKVAEGKAIRSQTANAVFK